ncbi:MAG: sulfopyruvate decarboxylase subunit beta [Methanohalobium sp.]|uniref:sulfopyruvate decarboxylase subunit beta n=1 Tax=Methanohalobium sp. TaxID=2837493 RepID=UPI00397DC06E
MVYLDTSKTDDPENTIIQILQNNGIDYLGTLPCDRIKNLLPLISRNFVEIPLTREENGVGICAGLYMAGAKPMMVIQSSGLGNMINALESLNIACHIPLPIIASWRGVYKEGIEAQKPLGKALPSILEGAGIKYTIIDETGKLYLLGQAISDSFETRSPHIILISPKVWEPSTCSVWSEQESVSFKKRSYEIIHKTRIFKPEMKRYDAIYAVSPLLNNEILVANIGIPCKELYSIRDRGLNYYMLGSLGLASSIGMGLALKSGRKVVVLDGDGSILMNPNALLEIARANPSNLIVIALDNGAHGSTGSQETFTAQFLDLEILAQAFGFVNTTKVHTKKELEEAFINAKNAGGLTFIHVILKPGNVTCENIALSPVELTDRFMNALKLKN